MLDLPDNFRFCSESFTGQGTAIVLHIGKELLPRYSREIPAGVATQESGEIPIRGDVGEMERHRQQTRRHGP